MKRLFFSMGPIALLGLAVYWNSLTGQFVWDDEPMVQHNPFIKNWAHLGQIFTGSIKASEGVTSSFYRPVQILSYLIDYSFWKLNVVGYHLTNIFWHIAAALTVFGFVQALFKKPWLSLGTALLFVVHPAHTEAVAYISGRADPLAAFFILLAFTLYIKSLETKKIFLTSLMSLTYLLALLSKEVSLILPALALLYHIAFKKPLAKKQFGFLVVTLLAYGIWRVGFAQAESTPALSSPSLAERIPGFFVAFSQYPRLLIAPFHLHMEYGGLLFPSSDPRVWVGAFLFLLFLGILAYTFGRRKRHPLALFSLGWFLIALLPSSNIFFTLNAYMAEHWLYLPSIGFCLLVTQGLFSLGKKPGFRLLAVLAGAGLLVFYGFLTVRQNRYWREPAALYERTLKYAPYSSRLYNNLAKAYHDLGQEDKLIELLQSAIKIDPENVEAYNNLGNAHKEAGNIEEAIRAYKRAIELKPGHASFYYNLSLIYADDLKNQEEALKLLRRALELNPYYPDVYHKIGLIYLDQGRREEAIELLKQAQKINPDRAEIHHSLGYLYVAVGNFEEAKAMYQRAVEVDPRYGKAHHDLAVLYLREGQYALAREHGEQAAAYGQHDPALMERLKAYR